MRTLSSVRVRNVARVGGALAHGDPHMDLPPVLSALGARVSIAGPNANRELPLEKLYAGYYETVLEKNELITAVTVPSLNGRKAAYMKVTSRTVDDWPSLGVAVRSRLPTAAFSDPIVVVSAATEKVTRMSAAEKALQGAAPDDAALQRAAMRPPMRSRHCPTRTAPRPTSGNYCASICAVQSVKRLTITRARNASRTNR